uniref:Thaumatin-like protein n=1 Tax=Oryza sativa subsp. japonica TaxID=39947 RepID=Q69N79_ORYSJ|nr:thaumatin-like protein [Oryza sativa Japonica Group]BAD36238.1 thaumatin-like protein [Oryza sativa Japonica Group]
MVARVCGGEVVSVVVRERKTVAELGLAATKPAVAAEQCYGGSSNGKWRLALTKAMAARVGSGGGSPVVDWGSGAVDGVRRGAVMPTSVVAWRGGGASGDEVQLEATNGSAA